MRKYFLISAILIAAMLQAFAGFIHAEDPDFEALARLKGEDARVLIDSPTLFRKTVIAGMPCSTEDFDFLLDRPRTSVALAGKIHKSLDRYVIDMTKPGVYHIDDQGKLVGDMELVVRGPGKRMYYITGNWKLLPGVRLNGRMALIVEYKDSGVGRYRKLDATARGYMKVDSTAAGAAFRLFAYLFPRKVDARIERFATAVRKVVEAIHDDPGSAMKRLENSRNVPKEEVREFKARFIKVSGEGFNTSKEAQI